jgi:hypothetical protein
MYTIDVDRGAIVSKHTSNENEDMLSRRPIHSQNLLTVIRLDYTLTSINQREGSRSWNMTVSEVMAIQKGTKSEIAIKPNTDLNSINSNLPEKLDHLISNADNPIISIHKFIKDQNTPVKLYDHKPKNMDDFYRFYEKESNITIVTEKDYFKTFSNYLKWSAEQFREINNVVKPKSLFHLIALKFYEMYYLDQYFFFFSTVIFILLTSIMILVYMISKYRQKNKDLKNTLENIRKFSEEENQSNSPRKVSISPELVFTKEEQINNEIKELQVYNKEKVVLNEIIKIDPNIMLTNPLLPLDQKLKQFEKENMAVFQVNVKEDEDGSLIKEEYTTRRTRYENNSIVKSTFKQIEKHVNKINQEFEVDELRVPRKTSFDYGNYINVTNDLDKNTFSETCRPKSKEIASPKRFESGFTMQTYQNKDETKIILKPTKSFGKDDIEITEENDNEKQRKEVNNTTAVQIYSKGRYNYKGYSNVVQQSTSNILRINTTYIDEGRLEKNFEGFEKIGQGGFGSVFKAKHKIDDSLYAIKVIKLKVAQSHNLMEYKEIKEVKTMMRLNHKNVVRYFTCWFQLMINGIAEFAENIESEANTLTQSFLYNKSMSKTYTSMARHHNMRDIKSLNKISENNESESGGAWNWDEHKDKVKEEEKESMQSASRWRWHDDGESKTKKGSIVFYPQNETVKSRALSLSLEKEDDDNIEDYSRRHANDDSILSGNRHHKHSKKEPLYDVYFFMQMEFCDGLPLNQYVDAHKETGIDSKIIFSFFKQIVSGVNHIHKSNVIHRDLK